MDDSIYWSAVQKHLRCGEGAVQKTQTAGEFGARALIWEGRVILTSELRAQNPDHWLSVLWCSKRLRKRQSILATEIIFVIN